MSRPVFSAVLLALVVLAGFTHKAHASEACGISVPEIKNLAYHGLGHSMEEVSGATGMPFEVVTKERMTTYRFGREDCYLAFSTFEGDDTIRAVAKGAMSDTPDEADLGKYEYFEGLSNTFDSEPTRNGVHRWSWGDVDVEWKTEGRLSELAFIWLGSGDKPSFPITLEGVWERRGDEYAGMRVRVYRAGEDYHDYEAHLISVPESARLIGFETGQTKWANIYERGNGHYTFEDLYVGGIHGSRHRESAIRVEGDRLQTALMDGEALGTGQSQTWVRVGNE